MTSSSPLRRRSYQFTTPQRSSIALIDYLSESKNSEERHRKLLEAADKEHERVIADAERVFQQCQRLDHERRLKEEQRHIALQKQQEQDRLLLQAQVAREREELQRLREASASPAPSPAATLHHSPATPEPATASASGAKGLFGGKSVNALKAQQPPRSSPLAQPAEQAQPPALAPAIAQTIPRKPSQPFAEAQRASVSTFSSGVSTFSIPTATEQPKPQQQASSPALRSATGPDRYQTIHQNLKDLRKDLVQQAKVNPRLKARMGDMRREIRKSVGQLTGEKGANTSQTQKVMALLREALSGSIPCKLLNPNDFVLKTREPVDGATRNDAQLPSLFFYLINIFSKAALSQWRNEGSAKPDTAGPVGVVVVGIFAEPEFLWRGQSLIDILIAKFRVSCPVLFGFRGSEKTDGGRKALGWKKDSGLWVSEQQHYDNQAGLGAGFAAIALRSFGKSKKQNPYPPTHYWTAMARILDTPSREISNTQCVVLKAMIAFGETKFLTFYGNAALEALRLALIDFPARAPEKTAAVTALSVHAQVLRRDQGLVLDA